jgi:hypothetical protein
LLRFDTYYIFCLFFSTMSNVEEVNPYHHLFHLLESCWLHTHILFQYLCSYFLHFIASVRGCRKNLVIFIFMFLTFHCHNCVLSEFFRWLYMFLSG